MESEGFRESMGRIRIFFGSSNIFMVRCAALQRMEPLKTVGNECRKSQRNPMGWNDSGFSKTEAKGRKSAGPCLGTVYP